MPLDLYKAKHKVGMYRSVKIDGVDCEADTCTVKLSLTYDYKRIKGITTPLVEKWIITQGQAWFVDQRLDSGVAKSLQVTQCGNADLFVMKHQTVIRFARCCF